MAITLTSNFTVNIASPIDDRFQVADITARDAIASGRRYPGLTVYVEADAANYQLQGGITNGDWVDVTGSGSISTADNLTAFAGGGQASALALTAIYNRVTTVATIGDSVKLPAATAGSQIVVINGAAASSMDIFPVTGEQIDALGVNIAYPLSVDARNVTFICVTAGTWISKAGGGGGSGSGILVVADLTARNAIDPGDRYEGLLVYVEAEELNFQLQAGILDANWVEVLSGPPLTWGTRATPMDIIAGTGISSAADKMSTTRLRQLLFVAGDAAGENDITANPQISAHTIVGAEMRIVGRNSSDYIKLNNGTGLDLAGGDPWYGFEGNSLDLVWDGASWFETNRRG